MNNKNFKRTLPEEWIEYLLNTPEDIIIFHKRTRGVEQHPCRGWIVSWWPKHLM